MKLKNTRIEMTVLVYFILRLLFFFFDVHQKHTYSAFIFDIILIVVYSWNHIQFRIDEKERKVREVEQALDRETQFSTINFPITVQINDIQGNPHSITIYENDSR